LAPIDITSLQENRSPGSMEEAPQMIPEEVTLVVIEGEPLGQRIAIGNAPIVIGRGLEVDLQISDPTVSRHHCVIWRASGRCWVRDLGSTNRTRINDRVAPVSELFEGDVLAVGQTALALSVNRAAGH
jgi:pSer/pThr/pTyr-binding forkhead associated (FHA) protein